MVHPNPERYGWIWLSLSAPFQKRSGKAKERFRQSPELSSKLLNESRFSNFVVTESRKEEKKSKEIINEIEIRNKEQMISVSNNTKGALSKVMDSVLQTSYYKHH